MQKKVKIFNDNRNCHKKDMSISARLANIQSELGELSREYLNNSKYGTADFQVNDDFKMEYGDVLYCLLSLANELNIDAEQCLNKALEKYQARIDKKNSMSNK